MDVYFDLDSESDSDLDADFTPDEQRTVRWIRSLLRCILEFSENDVTPDAGLTQPDE